MGRVFTPVQRLGDVQTNISQLWKRKIIWLHPETWHVSSLIKSRDFLGFTSVSSEAQFPKLLGFSASPCVPPVFEIIKWIYRIVSISQIFVHHCMVKMYHCLVKNLHHPTNFGFFPSAPQPNTAPGERSWELWTHHRPWPKGQTPKSSSWFRQPWWVAKRTWIPTSSHQAPPPTNQNFLKLLSYYIIPATNCVLSFQIFTGNWKPTCSVPHCPQLFGGDPAPHSRHAISLARVGSAAPVVSCQVPFRLFFPVPLLEKTKKLRFGPAWDRKNWMEMVMNENERMKE